MAGQLDTRKNVLMFAVIKSGGKQYKVAKDDVIRVEKLDAEEGATVNLNEVLMVGDDKSQTVGAPLVDGAAVSATVLEQMRDRKIIVFQEAAPAELSPPQRSPSAPDGLADRRYPDGWQEKGCREEESGAEERSGPGRRRACR